MEKKQRIKKATYKELAEYLGVSVSAVSQYNKKKRLLMLIGLTVKKNLTKRKK